jgi:hypothetical protein
VGSWLFRYVRDGIKPLTSSQTPDPSNGPGLAARARRRAARRIWLPADREPESSSYSGLESVDVRPLFWRGPHAAEEAVKVLVDYMRVRGTEFAAFGQYWFTGNNRQGMRKAITKI